jgi:hypothetical protein
VLASNGFPNERTLRIAERLEANVLVIHDDSPTVVVSLDLLYAGQAIRQSLRRRFPEVDSDRLMVAASHTHRAPGVDPSKPKLGVVDTAYVEFVCTTLGEAVAWALHHGPIESVVIRSHAGETTLTVNRRRRRLLRVGGDGILFRKWSYGPSSSGPTDSLLNRADLVSDDGRVVCTLWRLGCHPSSAPDSLAINPDFVGRVRAALRKRHGSHPVLFFQGFSGDVRCPSVTRFRETPLTTLRLGTHFRNFTDDEYRAWTQDLTREVLGLPAVDAEASPLAAGRFEFAQNAFVYGGSGSPAVFQYLRVGPLILVGVSAEVVAEYADALRGIAARAGLEPGQLWPVGCTDDVFGYAPTSAILEEGGYEGAGFVHALSLAGVNPTIESAMVGGFRSVIDALGQGQGAVR